MSIQHLLSPELNIDVKSLKINGTPSGGVPFIEFTPVITSTKNDTFTNLKSFYRIIGNKIELSIQGRLETGTLNSNDSTLFITNPQARPFTNLVNPVYSLGHCGGNLTQVGFDVNISIPTNSTTITVQIVSTNTTIPLSEDFSFQYNSILDIV